MAGKKRLTSPLDLAHIRKLSGLNQHDFWAAVGVTQSGGSRYETDRRMPTPVAKLVQLVHVDGIKHPEAVRELVDVASRALLRLSVDQDPKSQAIAEKLSKAIAAVIGEKV